MKDNLGLEYAPWYYKLLPQQEILTEIALTHNFINEFFDNCNIKEFKNKTEFKFINYGSKQLVFVVSVKNGKHYTMLVNQPATSFGMGKKEFDNLTKLSSEYPNIVVKPLGYYHNNGKELYITPYYYQARCIGVDNQWGMWIPEPTYHFEKFTEKEEENIISKMIALLVLLYDDINKTGISECRLDGGDFILEKDYDEKDILNSLKLIAAREFIKLDLNEYLDILKKELTSNIDNPIIIGKKIRKELTSSEVENGIELGLKLKEKIKCRR